MISFQAMSRTFILLTAGFEVYDGFVSALEYFYQHITALH